MAENLTFMMGKYAAVLPPEYLYCRNHMWCLPGPDSCHRFGFTNYAVQLMKDVYFLEWSVATGDAVKIKQKIGYIETSKAVSELFAPISCTITEFNQKTYQDPSEINLDCHGTGWLFSGMGGLEGTMSAQEYHAYLVPTWESTQRILKGQMKE